MTNSGKTTSMQEQLNALADGELDSVQADKLRSRIDQDRQLAAEYERILDIKERISKAGLANVPASTAQTHTSFQSPQNRSWQPWAIAASLVMVAGLAALLAFGSGLSGTSDPRGIVAWHQHFSDKHYVVEKSSQRQLVSFAPSSDFHVPDLSDARLFLVDHRVIEAERPQAIFHYRGLKGCRLTVLYSEAGIHLPQTTEQLRSWKAGTATLAMIASGMDADRFRAIGNYIETMSKQTIGDDQRLAMGKVTRSARSCA